MEGELYLIYLYHRRKFLRKASLCTNSESKRTAQTSQYQGNSLTLQPELD